MLLPTHALVLSVHLATAIFLHEKSAVDLQGGRNSSYGFSLGYQSGDAKLIIGAPRYNNEGKVYRCPVQKTKDEKGTCLDPVDIKIGEPLLYDRSLSPDQYFYLGASIAATKNGFVTCAPLRTLSPLVKKYGAYGACFAYHNNTVKVWNLHAEYESVAGGAGWSTLSDENNDIIIVSRFFKEMNAAYTQMSNPENYTSCLSRSIVSLTDVTIYGQAMSLGNFFNKNKTTYAFSMNTLLNQGNIDFISVSSDLETIWSFEYRLPDSNVGMMFGAALCSADVTRDGLDELFVGAPAQVVDASNYDTGAVHVYTKTKSDKTEMMLHLSIWGVKSGAWFGSALSTYDINGDSYPEIIVSAPFEKSGGVLYVICGFALYKNKRTTISVLELPRTQRIERSQSFGFSLQPVADYNENGSDELAVGAPETSTVTMYQGVPAITANVTSEFRNYATYTNTEFSFASCVTIQRPEKPKEITTRLLVENVLSGQNAVFKNGENASYEISLNKPTNISGNLYEYCKNFTIESPLSCKVNTTVSVKDNIEIEPEFKNTWVTLSSQSCLSKETQPQCSCDGRPCSPAYSVELLWAGKSGSNHRYIVGSSDQETVTIVVRNTGTMGCGACVIVRVRGSLVPSLPCRPGEGYRCELPTPFRAGTNKTIDVQLLTHTLSTQEKSLTIEAEVRKECTKPEAVKSSLSLTYDFSKVLENVIINGSTINRTFSDGELDDTNEDKLSVEQTFTIFNTQSFKWNNALMTMDTDNRPYIQNITVRMRQSIKPCESSTDSSYHYWKCSFNLAPNSTTEITVVATIIKKKIASYLQSGTIKIESKLKVKLIADGVKEKSILTLIILEKEKSPVVTIIIAIVVALLVLLVIGFILYKLNFFKRKGKEELEELKKERRNRSTRSAVVPETQPVADPAAEVVVPEPDHDFDMVDLIVDETPLRRALSSEELNSIAAYVEPCKKEPMTKKKGELDQE